MQAINNPPSKGTSTSTLSYSAALFHQYEPEWGVSIRIWDLDLAECVRAHILFVSVCLYECVGI